MTGHEHATATALTGPVLLGLLAAASYLVMVGAARRRGRTWPLWRTALWLLGASAAVAAVTGMPATGHEDFRAHMVGHVLLGMLAPLLLVLAAPFTLALRALPARSARRMTAVLRSRPLAVLTHPITAAVPNVGGLWALYRTSLYAASQHDGVLLSAVHVHVLLAGYLFTYSVVGPDPTPHRAPLPLRATVLVISVAAHNILAKTLYALPPDGVPAEQAATGAQLMYYAGGPIEIALFTVIGAEWFRAQTRSARLRPPPSVPSSSPADATPTPPAHYGTGPPTYSAARSSPTTPS